MRLCLRYVEHSRKLKFISCFFAGINVIAVAVGNDIDINNLRKYVKSAEDLILPQNGAQLADLSIAKKAVQRACHFAGKSTFEY